MGRQLTGTVSYKWRGALSTFERIIEALERITVKTVKCYTVIIDHVELIDYITQLTPIQTGSTVLAVLQHSALK